MKICIPIKEKSQKKAIERLKEAKKNADLAELWLDQIQDLNLPDLLNSKILPLVIVCKKPIEQGNFKGSYKDIADLLLQAIKIGVEYVDIPLKMPENLSKKIVQAAKKQGTKCIISHHNFKNTPSLNGLKQKAALIAKRHPDVIKIATKANTHSDMINIVGLAKELQLEGQRHILIAMGKKGMLSRILTPTLGGEMMFAVLDKKKQTAPGQLTIKELKDAWKLIKAK